MKTGPWFSITDLWLWVHLTSQGLTGGHTIYLYPLPIILDWPKSSFGLFGKLSLKNPMDIFANPVFPLRRVCGKSAALLPSDFSTQKTGIWHIENRLNETAVLVIHEYWLDHAFTFSQEWLSANYLVVNLSQKKIKLHDSNM